MEYTKGPWNSGPFHGAQGIEIQSEKRAVAVALHGNLTFEETQANARLIAASPAMYEALRKVIAWWEIHQYDTTGDHGEYNIYDIEPDFVTMAKKILEGRD